MYLFLVEKLIHTDVLSLESGVRETAEKPPPSGTAVKNGGRAQVAEPEAEVEAGAGEQNPKLIP